MESNGSAASGPSFLKAPVRSHAAQPQKRRRLDLNSQLSNLNSVLFRHHKNTEPYAGISHASKAAMNQASAH